MLAGEILRQRRRALGVTLQDLADKTGLSVGFISRIERNMASPSLASLISLSKALSWDVENFLVSGAPGMSVSRADDRTVYSVSPNGQKIARVSGKFPGSWLNAFICKVPPGHTVQNPPQDGEELLYVIEGEIWHSLNGQDFQMKAGDVIHFPPRHTRSCSNRSNKETTILWVGTTSKFD